MCWIFLHKVFLGLEDYVLDYGEGKGRVLGCSVCRVIINNIIFLTSHASHLVIHASPYKVLYFPLCHQNRSMETGHSHRTASVAVRWPVAEATFGKGDICVLAPPAVVHMLEVV